MGLMERYKGESDITQDQIHYARQLQVMTLLGLIHCFKTSMREMRMIALLADDMVICKYFGWLSTT